MSPLNICLHRKDVGLGDKTFEGPLTDINKISGPERKLIAYKARLVYSN